MDKHEKHLKINLKKLLEDKGMSVNDLAEKAGFSYVTILSMKNGKYKRIGLDTIERLCKALKCELTDLLVWE